VAAPSATGVAFFAALRDLAALTFLTGFVREELEGFFAAR
jgi:hypothetical protein